MGGAGERGTGVARGVQRTTSPTISKPPGTARLVYGLRLLDVYEADHRFRPYGSPPLWVRQRLDDCLVRFRGPCMVGFILSNACICNDIYTAAQNPKHHAARTERHRSAMGNLVDIGRTGKRPPRGEVGKTNTRTGSADIPKEKGTPKRALS